VAALFLERGGELARRFLQLTLFNWVKGKEDIVWDYKSRLQEHCQANKNEIKYQLKKIESKQRKQVFVTEVSDELNTFKETGRGFSKKEAEQEAAAKVIKKLKISIT
jgi:ribonuclease-3